MSKVSKNRWKFWHTVTILVWQEQLMPMEEAQRLYLEAHRDRYDVLYQYIGKLKATLTVACAAITGLILLCLTYLFWALVERSR